MGDSLSPALEIIVEKVLASPEDRTASAAQEIDSLLSTHLESWDEEKAVHKEQRHYEFFARLSGCLMRSSLRIPIENESQHESLAELIIELSKLERDEMSERDEIYRWQDLPEIWIGFEEKWHSIGPGGDEDQDWKRINFAQATLIGLNSARPLSEASTSLIRNWARWGVVVLIQSLQIDRSDSINEKLPRNESHMKKETLLGWLETSEIWIRKAGVEMLRSTGLEVHRFDGQGAIWKLHLKEIELAGSRWKFWKERLRALQGYEGTDEEGNKAVRTLSRSMVDKMDKIEANFD